MEDEMNILRIQTSPRGDSSESRKLGTFLIEEARRNFGTVEVVTRDLSDGAPLLNAAWIAANFTEPDKRSQAQHDALALSETLIKEIENADALVIEAPIWNFSIPSSLKAWIDQVVRARRTFRMLENGYEGLLKDRKAHVIVTSGGVPLGSGFDFATPYIRHILGFIGIRDVEFIDASRLLFDNAKSDVAKATISERLSAISKVAA
jgi:FMN-dependent NADH-azoreductase